MTRLRYPFAFSLAVLGLTVVALGAYARISTSAVVRPAGGGTTAPVDTTPIFAPAAPADYARFAEDDRAWRDAHARPVTLAELRARGDGTRTPRQALQDRVYRYTQRGDPARAIAELEAWIRSNPRDEDALLWQARLLAGAGRTDEAVQRYRQVISLQERGNR